MLRLGTRPSLAVQVAVDAVFEHGQHECLGAGAAVRRARFATSQRTELIDPDAVFPQHALHWFHGTHASCDCMSGPLYGSAPRLSAPTWRQIAGRPKPRGL